MASAPGRILEGWRRALAGLSVGAVVGLLAGLLLPRDADGARRGPRMRRG